MIAKFEFTNISALAPNENLSIQGDNGIVIRIFRSLRNQSFPDMKQPARNGAIMGMETLLEIVADGQPAINYRWRLYKNNKFMQSGNINNHGFASIDVALPIDIDSNKYRLVILKPTKKR